MSKDKAKAIRTMNATYTPVKASNIKAFHIQFNPVAWKNLNVQSANDE